MHELAVLKVAQFLGAVSERDLLTLSFGMRSPKVGRKGILWPTTRVGIGSMGTRLKLPS